MQISIKSFVTETMTKTYKIPLNRDANVRAIAINVLAPDVEYPVWLIHEVDGAGRTTFRVAGRINDTYAQAVGNEVVDVTIASQQYYAFVTEWNVEAERLQEIEKQKAIAIENEKIAVIMADINKVFPVMGAIGGEKVDNQWSFNEPPTSTVVILYCNLVKFRLRKEYDKWELTVFGEYTSTAYESKRSKNLLPVLKYILEICQEYFDRAKIRFEERRREKLLRTVMTEAGWEHDSGSRWIKNRPDGGEYKAWVEMDDAPSERVYIVSLSRKIAGMEIVPSKNDCCIME